MMRAIVWSLGLLALLAVGSQGSSAGLIAYSVHNNGVDDGDIYVMGADGSNPTQLTAFGGRSQQPAWSRDGTKIAFCSNRGSGKYAYHIFVMDADGGNLTQLTYGAGSDDHSPAWSPDGTRIAFHTRQGMDLEVCVMSATGRNQTNITNNPAVDGFPCWSPDGTRIAFNSDRNGVRFSENQPDLTLDVYTMGTDGSNVTQLTSSASSTLTRPFTLTGFSLPRWSPDGTRIACMTGAVGYIIMDADGSNQKWIARDLRPFGVSWSPDGQRLAVANMDPEMFSDIYVVSVDGATRTQLTTGGTSGLFLDWSPVVPTAVAPTSWGRLKGGFR